MTKSSRVQTVLVIVALGLISFGSWLAWIIQTSAGDVEVRDIRFSTKDGQVLSALLYVPGDASIESPLPGILAVHGYINSRETQSGFAIEFARRGQVVLALDQTGHGYSAPPAMAAGFGGPAGLNYLLALPFVDPGRIGLEGHSMGGWAVQMAAAQYPDAYQAMVLEGSSTGSFGAPEGTPISPRNLLLVFSLFDEFSALMWGADIPADIVHTDKLKNLFGSRTSIVANKRYGDGDKGTARQLAMPAVTHPGDHLSRDAIGAAITWFNEQLNPPRPLPASNQIWFWKELGTLLALAGLYLLIFPLTTFFIHLFGVRPSSAQGENTPPDEAKLQVGSLKKFATLGFTVLLPIILFFPLQNLANIILPANPVLPQQITNGVLVWAWGVGLVSVSILFYRGWRGGTAVPFKSLNLNWTQAMRHIGTAFCVLASTYLIVWIADLFLVDFRFWVVALKFPSFDQALMTLLYLPAFTAFFLIQSVSLHTQFQGTGAWAMWRNGLILSGGFVVLLTFQYVPLFMGSTLTINQPLLTIVAFQFVPLLLMAGLVSTWCLRRTGNVLTGVIINSVLITAYMVAGTATQVVPFWY